MTNSFVETLADAFFDAQGREMNLLEWKYEIGGTITIKAEDLTDGLIGIYTIQLDFRGFAKSLNNGNFEIEE